MIAAVFMVSILLLILTLYGVTSKIINDFAVSVATRQVDNNKNKIMAVIDREVVLAQKMADDNLLKEWFLSPDSPRLRTSALKQLESYRRLFRDKSYFVAIGSNLRYYVANKTAEATVALLNRENKDDKWYFESIKSVDNFALNLDYNAAIHKAKIWINVIMKDEKGRKIGIVGSGIDISDFLDSIVQNGEKGITAILVDEHGVIQAHQNRELVEKNALERDEQKKTAIFGLLKDADSAEKMKRALDNLPKEHMKVATFPLHISGNSSIAAVSYLPQIGWFNIVLVDVSHVLGFNNFLPIILVSVLALILVIAIIGIQMNRMLLAPLVLLTSAAKQIAIGNYSVTVPTDRHDEIGDLSKSFSRMADTVQKHTADLENAVRIRTEELTLANSQLEKSQQRIQESIEYASVIQNSILPAEALFNRAFSEWFVLYKPCDIVSGDLYWLRECKGRTLLAVVDCTGHGVPGGFMTMTVHSLLNQIIDTVSADDPGRILSELNRQIQQTLNLRQTDDRTVDAGVDIALCSLDSERKSMVFAGAGISLFTLSNGNLKEIPGDRQRVGYRSSHLDYSYTNKSIGLDRETVYYTASDGFFDEGGGEKGYSFGNERFNAMLVENAGLPLKEQPERFNGIIAKWRGSRKQRDDITMVGFKL